MNYYGRRLLERVCPQFTERIHLGKKSELFVRNIKISDIKPDKKRNDLYVFHADGGFDSPYPQQAIHPGLWIDNPPSAQPLAFVYSSSGDFVNVLICEEDFAYKVHQHCARQTTKQARKLRNEIYMLQGCFDQLKENKE